MPLITTDVSFNAEIIREILKNKQHVHSINIQDTFY